MASVRQSVNKSLVATGSIRLNATYCIATPEQVRKMQERESTKIKKRTYLMAFSQVPSTTFQLCDQVGISRGTFYYWMKNDPEFRAEIHKIISLMVHDVETMLFRQAVTGKDGAMKFVLKHWHPRYMAPAKARLMDKSLEEEFEADSDESEKDDPLAMKY